MKRWSGILVAGLLALIAMPVSAQDRGTQEQFEAWQRQMKEHYERTMRQYEERGNQLREAMEQLEGQRREWAMQFKAQMEEAEKRWHSQNRQTDRPRANDRRPSAPRDTDRSAMAERVGRAIGELNDRLDRMEERISRLEGAVRRMHGQDAPRSDRRPQTDRPQSDRPQTDRARPNRVIRKVEEKVIRPRADRDALKDLPPDLRKEIEEFLDDVDRVERDDAPDDAPRRRPMVKEVPGEMRRILQGLDSLEERAKEFRQVEDMLRRIPEGQLRRHRDKIQEAVNEIRRVVDQAEEAGRKLRRMQNERKQDRMPDDDTHRRYREMPDDETHRGGRLF